jgi:GT2 family glycosyltransferase
MAVAQQLRVEVVILNTNRREDSIACLRSLFRSTYPFLHVTELDNASTDGSSEAFNRDFPEASVVALSDNRGYAGNNNVGIQRALDHGADWVFVLNEDTIVDPDCVRELVAVGESDRRIGIVGPLVYHHQEPDVVQSAGGLLTRRWEAVHRGINERDIGQFCEPSDVTWVSGCAILVRRAVIEQVGMLDERFFYYWEETDWCLRAREHGWRVVHAPSAKLWHKGVQRDYAPSPGVSYYNARNRLLFLRAHHAPVRVWGATSLQMARTLSSMSLRPHWRAQRRHRNAMARGVFDFVRSRWGKGPY